jgi:2-oxoglutarate dehydrogenase E2 component (dihydrolipoamide succinyltransferase)
MVQGKNISNFSSWSKSSGIKKISMALVDLVMPKLGESIMEATILKWTKKVGDTVKQDETLLEIATDKVDSEVPSTSEGILSEVLFNENDVVLIGTVIARINTSETADVPEQDGNPQPSPSLPIDEQDDAPEEYVPFVPKPVSIPAMQGGSNNNKFFSPLVLSIANSEGLPLSELENIRGTGNEGRVTKRDILQHIADKKAGKPSAPALNIQKTQTAQAELQQQQPTSAIQHPIETKLPQPQTASEPDINVASLNVETKVAPATNETAAASEQSFSVPTGNVEIVEMDRMRKLIAKHMVSSKQTSAHVTSFAEADVTNMVMWREKVKNQFEKQEGSKITFTPMFITCLTRIIKRYPYINCSVEGEKIIFRKDINIGMATSLPGGNLIVPVIKNADHLNLVGLTKSVNTLATNARNNRLKADDTSGGTFTLTNVGTFGSLMGTPIINQPQVAILAVGAIKKRPVVIETVEGDSIGIRHMMYLSLSYDHRVVDGSVGASFLTEVAKEFEKWDSDTPW